MKRFVHHEGQVFKDINQVQCTPNISLPLTDSEVTYRKNFRLLATVNHTGTLERGHYTAFIKIANTDSWLYCNDAAVLKADQKQVNNASSYIYFYEAI